MPFIGIPPFPSPNPDVLYFTAMEDLLSAPSPKVEGTLAKVRRYYGNYTTFESGTPQLNYQLGDFLGGGLFYWTEESINIDNLLTFPAATGGTWVRVIESGQPFDIRWSGAYGNGLNDDTQSMVNAFSMMQNTIQGNPPTYFPDLYGKIGNTIFFPAGSYVINEGASFTFYGKAVGHQYFNPNLTTNPTLSSSFIVNTIDEVSFVSQEFRNLNIEGSSNSTISINAVNVSGSFFTAPITISPNANPFPQTNAPTNPLGSVTIQGCQFLTNGSCLTINNLAPSPQSPQVIIKGSVFQGGIEVYTNLSDLVINDCYVMNSSGDYVPGIPQVSIITGSISAMSPSVKAITLTSGTSATNPAYLLTGTIRIPVTLNPTTTAAATVSVAITDQYGNSTTTTMASSPKGGASGIVQTITFDVPPQASYTVTATNATLEEGTISYNATGISLAATSVSLG
jgi:hypothetical protein